MYVSDADPSFDRTQAELKRDAFSYDPQRDCFRCPNGKELHVNTLHRTASGLAWVSLADKRECQDCPLREKYLSENDKRGARKPERNSF